MKIQKYLLVSVVFTMFATVAWAKTPTSISVMAYNVENLFDTVHDAGKEDWTYLPLSVKSASKEVQAYCKSLSNGTYRKDCYNIDWSDSLLEKKLNQIGKVIKSVNNGNGPDIIVFEEVENLNVLTMLRDKALTNMGYTEVVLVEGPDDRGIDVGMISKYPLVEPAVLHPIKLIDPKTGLESSPTRGVLQAKFQVGDAIIGVLGNHWPSQSHVDEMRVQAAKVMINAVSKMKDANAVVSVGDFNTLEDDTPNAISDYVTETTQAGMIDSEMERRKSFPAGLSEGTHFYRNEWASLDRIFVKTVPPAFCGVEVKPNYKAFNIVTTPDSVKDIVSSGKTFRNVPYRFDYKTALGVTDHLPVVLELELVKVSGTGGKGHLCAGRK